MIKGTDRNIPLSELHPFKDHPFKVLDDEAMLKMELIEEDGDWHEEMLEKVDEAIKALNPQTRRVLDLCYFQGKKYAEAAEVLGISANTVHKHISKAMAFLREVLFNKKY